MAMAKKLYDGIATLGAVLMIGMILGMIAAVVNLPKDQATPGLRPGDDAKPPVERIITCIYEGEGHWGQCTETKGG